MTFPGKIVSSFLLYVLMISPLWSEEEKAACAPAPGIQAAEQEEEGLVLRTVFLPFHMILDSLLKGTGLERTLSTPEASELTQIPLTVNFKCNDLTEALEYLCGAAGLDYRIEGTKVILFPASGAEGSLSPQFFLERSRDLYRRTLLRFSDSPRVEEAYFQLGRLELRSGDYRAAAENFSLVMSQFPNGKRGPESLFLCGKAFFHLREWKRARAFLLAFLNNHVEDPLTPNVYVHIAETLVREQREEEAIQYLDLLAKSFPDWKFTPEALLKAAHLHVCCADLEAAKEAVSMCRGKELTERQKQKLLKTEVQIFREEKDWLALEEALTQLLHMDLSRAEAAQTYFQLAEVFLDSGQALRAVFCLQTLLHDYLDTTDPPRVLLSLGKCYAEVGLAGYAMEALSKAREMAGHKEEDLILEMARTFFRAGGEREACALLEDALEEEDHSSDFYLALAGCYFETGRFEACLNFIHRCPERIRTSESWEELGLLAGDCLFLLGRIDEAEKAYRGFFQGGKK